MSQVMNQTLLIVDEDVLPMLQSGDYILSVEDDVLLIKYQIKVESDDKLTIY